MLSVSVRDALTQASSQIVRACVRACRPAARAARTSPAGTLVTWTRPSSRSSARSPSSPTWMMRRSRASGRSSRSSRRRPATSSRSPARRARGCSSWKRAPSRSNCRTAPRSRSSRGVLRRAGDPGARRHADRARAGDDGRALPRGGAPRLRRDPRGGARHRGGDAPGARAQDRGPRGPRLIRMETFDVGIVGAGRPRGLGGVPSGVAGAQRGHLRTVDAGGRSHRSFERRVSRVLHEHVPRDRRARQHRDDGAVPGDHRCRRRIPPHRHVVPASPRRRGRRGRIGRATERSGDRHRLVRTRSVRQGVPLVRTRRDRRGRARTRRRIRRSARDDRRAVPAGGRAGRGRSLGCPGGAAGAVAKRVCR